MFINKITATLIFTLFTFNVYAGVCEESKEPRSQKDWVLSNMCHFTNTALVTVNDDYLKEWYNPRTHLRSPNIFVYEIELIDIYKGKKPKTTCMLQSVEASFVISAGKKGTRNIVSYSDVGKCIVIEVGAMQSSSKELEAYAKKIAIQLKNEQQK